MTRIGLMGPFGFGNLGDAAIQEAMIDNLRVHIAGVEIVAFSLNPADTQKRHGIRAFPIEAAAPEAAAPEAAAPAATESLADTGMGTGTGKAIVTGTRTSSWTSSWIFRLKRKLGIRLPYAYAVKRQLGFWWTSLAALRGLDALIVSGGGQLDDIWGGPWNQPFTLWQWALMARMRRVKFLFVGVGAGPIRTGLGRFFILSALRLACYRSFRDQESCDLMRRFGFTAPAEVFPDLAFSLRRRTSHSVRGPGVKAKVGISPMAYGHVDKWPDKMAAVYRRYIDTLAAFISYLANTGYQVILFPTQIRMDLPAFQDLKAALGRETAAHIEDRSCERPVTTVQELLDAMAQMDFIVASRFHGVLLAIFLAKPVLALSYHRKIDTLMQEAGLSEYCLDIEAFELKALTESFHALESAGASLGRELEALGARYHSVLDRQYDALRNQVAA